MFVGFQPRSFLLCAVATGCAVWVGALWAGEGSTASLSGWKLETVELSDHRILQGLIEDSDSTEIEFVQVGQVPGKPMHLIVLPLDRRNIVSSQKLPEEEHAALRERINRFRARATIEARRMENVRLTSLKRDGATGWQYQGDWFSLDSTTDEATTRRIVIRIEQMFTAYRQCLPPRGEVHARPLSILVFGEWKQYQKYLGGLGLELANPAFYAADFNIVAAGSDINLFSGEFAQVSRQNQAVKKQLDDLLSGLPEKKKELTAELEKNGFSAEDRKAVLALEQRHWDEQKRTLKSKIEVATRKNEAQFGKVSAAMFARLNHEAFHAYLENNVFPRATYDVPRWLNEGLAQVFEAGQLEDDVLRVDAPAPKALARLQADLRSAAPLPLAEILSADASTFLGDHRRAPSDATRSYLYAWGLAYYLTFQRDLLGTSGFEEYVRRASSEAPVERFEKLVGQPLSEFEPQWRAAILQLRASEPRKNPATTGDAGSPAE